MKRIILSLLVFMSSQLLFAQNKGDFKVTLTATPSECRSNGSVKMDVTCTKPSAREYKVHYNLLDKSGRSVTNTGQYVTNSLIGNLEPGEYTSDIKIEFPRTESSEGYSFILDKKTIKVKSNYTIPVIKVNLLRKSLNNYYPDGKRVPTGIIEITILKGKAPYYVKVAECPESYTGPRGPFELDEKNNSIKLYHIDAGHYRFEMGDICGKFKDQVLEVGKLKDDYPLSDDEFNYAIYAKQTSEMREKHCGWFMIKSYSTPGISDYKDNPDLRPYMFPDTIPLYYNYGWQTPKDTKAGKPIDFHPFDTPPFDDSKGYGNEKGMSAEAVYYKLSEGISYRMAGTTDEYWPNYYLQVKGDTRHSRGRRFDNYSNHNIIKYYDSLEPCKEDYELQVEAATDHDILLCLPIEVTLSSEGLKDQKLLIEKDGEKYTFPIKLSTNRTYKLFAQDAKSSKTEINIPRQTIEHSIKLDYENNKCKGETTFDFRITTTGKNLSGCKVRFVSAPEAFKPVEGTMAVGETYSLGDKYDSQTFYVLSKSESSQRPIVYNPDLVGEYKFELIDPCGVIHPLSQKLDKLDVQMYSANPDAFKPKVAKSPDCGRIRIYPYYGNSDGFVFINGKPIRTILHVEFPSEIKDNDIRTNIPRSMTRWYSQNKLDSHNSGVKDEELYIDLPEINGDVQFSFTDGGTTISCLPTIKVALQNLPLTFNRETYIGYSCATRKSGLLHIEPINYVGNVRMDLYSPDGKTKIDSREHVDKNGADFDLGSYLKGEEKIASNYILVITDEKCNNTAKENLIIYNLSSPAIIRTKGQERKFCEGDEIVLSSINMGGKDEDYEWTFPNNKVMKGRRVTVPALPEYSGTVRLLVQDVSCDGSKAPIEISFGLSIAPPELWWKKDAASDDWNCPANWCDKDGNKVNAVPAPCTDVHIPSVVDRFYPDLQNTTTDTYGNPECHNIYLHYGAKLGAPHRLTYFRAFVDYNFGILSADGSRIMPNQVAHHPGADDLMMQRDRWYMVATPLKAICVGDFCLAGKPMIYSRYVKTTKDQSLTNASFDHTFSMLKAFVSWNSYTEAKAINALSLKAASFGQKIGYNDHSCLNKLDGIIRIPFYEDETRMEAYPYHSYDPKRKMSVMRYFNKRTLKPLNKYDEVIRSASSYRFIFEERVDDPQNISKGTIGTVMLNGAPVEGYGVKINQIAKDEWFMLGNPFMTPISFDKLLEINRGLIYPYYYVYEANQWKVYAPDSPELSNLTATIEPLQSIVVRKKDSFRDELLFVTDQKKSILCSPNEKAVTYSHKDEIEPSDESLLRVKLTDRNGHQSSCFLHWNARQNTCVPAMSNTEDSDRPVVYMIDPDTEEGNYIESPCRPYSHIPLAVASPVGGQLRLEFEYNPSSYEQVILIDRMEGRTKQLYPGAAYDFFASPECPNSRFVISAKRYGIEPQGLEIPMPSVEMQLTGRDIEVKANLPIEQISLFDMEGKILFKTGSGNTGNLSQRVRIPQTPNFVVSVRLADGTRRIKKFINRL